MYVIVDKLKKINIGEDFELCLNCAIPTMSNNETMGKRGLFQCRQCHEVLIMELITIVHYVYIFSTSILSIIE